MDSDPMIDNEVGAHTRVTVLAYWKFKSVSLQQRVHKLSVPVRAGRRIAFTRAYRMQPLAQLPAVCATGLAAAAGWSSVLSISSNVRPLVSGPNAQKPITPRMYQDAK